MGKGFYPDFFFSDFNHNADGQRNEGKKVKAIMKTLQAFCAAKSSAEVLWHGKGVRDGEIFISKLSRISLISVFCFALLASSMGYFFFFFADGRHC